MLALLVNGVAFLERFRIILPDPAIIAVLPSQTQHE